MVKASFGGEYRDPASRPPTTTGLRRTGKAPSESHLPAPTADWIVVIPVKGTASAKSRFGDGDNSRLALAIALDTVDAALATPGVSGVLVVTSATASPVFDETEALVLIEDDPSDLRSAIELGIETAAEMGAPGRGIAVLLGDLPALTADELQSALEQARPHELAMVPDAEGTGTTLITAADGAAHNPAFGPGSAALHRSAGYAELDVPADSGLRMDADTRDTLDALAGRLGPHSAALG